MGRTLLQIAASHILLSHRVALQAAQRALTALTMPPTVPTLRMRSTFTFNSISFDLDPEFLHQTCVGGF